MVVRNTPTGVMQAGYCPQTGSNRSRLVLHTGQTEKTLYPPPVRARRWRQARRVNHCRIDAIGSLGVALAVVRAIGWPQLDDDPLLPYRVPGPDPAFIAPVPPRPHSVHRRGFPGSSRLAAKRSRAASSIERLYPFSVPSVPLQPGNQCPIADPARATLGPSRCFVDQRPW